MKINYRILFAPAAMAGLLLAAPLLHAQDRKITHDQLPAAVQHTMDAETQGSTVKGYATEVENGKRSYEAETVKNGHTRDVSFNPDGSLAEIEEEVPFNQLPAPVQQSLKTKARGAQIRKVESLTKHEKLVAYEATTAKGSEIQVGPTGEKLNHEE
jgi:hypothetical protein